MTTDTIRTLIRSQIDALGLTVGRAAVLAGLSDQTARDYLSGRGDLRAEFVFRLAAAVGVAVTAAPVKGFDPENPPENKSRKSGKRGLQSRVSGIKM